MKPKQSPNTKEKTNLKKGKLSVTTRIEQLRKENHMSQKQFADFLKISPGNLCDWERGRSEPNIERLIQIANLFNITIDYLVGKDDYDADNAFFNQNEFTMLINYKKLDTDSKDLVNKLIKKLGK